MSGDGPPPRAQTARAALADELRRGWATARELSGATGLSEKAVLEHLSHLRRSLKGRGERLEVEPAECVACGHRFGDRRRLSKPSRCPSCRSERITLPRYRLG